MRSLKYDLLNTNIALCGENPGIGSSTTSHALVYTLYNAGFKNFRFASASLRNLADYLGVASVGPEFVNNFLNTPYINNPCFDRLWDRAVANSIRNLNVSGIRLVFESKVALILNPTARLQLSSFYDNSPDFIEPSRVLKEYCGSEFAAYLPQLKVVYLRGTVSATIARMKAGGRTGDVEALLQRIETDKQRYLRAYGIDPYNSNLVVDSNIADVVIDTSSWAIGESMRKIFIELFGSKFVSAHLAKALKNLSALCDNSTFVDAKNALISANQVNGCTLSLDVSAQVVDEMSNLGYNFHN